MSRDRYRVHDDLCPYFLTCTVVGWLPVFTRSACAEVVLGSLRHMHESGRLTLFAYVLLENHLHLIAHSPALGAEVGRFKSFTARGVIDVLAARGDAPMLAELARHKLRHKTDREYQLWQEGGHPVRIDGDPMMEQKADYIHNNPVRRGYVDDPAHWRYSSARDYHGRPGLVPVLTDWKSFDPAAGRPTGRDAERPRGRSHAERGNEGGR